MYIYIYIYILVYVYLSIFDTYIANSQLHNLAPSPQTIDKEITMIKFVISNCSDVLEDMTDVTDTTDLLELLVRFANVYAYLLETTNPVRIHLVHTYVHICACTRVGESNRIRTVPEYGQCPNTDTLGISETINLTNECLMNTIFIII